MAPLRIDGGFLCRYYPACSLWVPSVSAVSECSSPNQFTGCVLTTTSETYMSHLSTSTALFSNTPTSFYIPLVPAQYFVGRGGKPIMFESYVIEALWFRYSGTATNVSLPSTTRIGYWTTSGVVEWYASPPFPVFMFLFDVTLIFVGTRQRLWSCL